VAILGTISGFIADSKSGEFFLAEKASAAIQALKAPILSAG
jgi:hypothetical protein